MLLNLLVQNNEQLLLKYVIDNLPKLVRPISTQVAKIPRECRVYLLQLRTGEHFMLGMLISGGKKMYLYVLIGSILQMPFLFPVMLVFLSFPLCSS